MKRVEYQIQTRAGMESVNGYGYKGFGVRQLSPGYWQASVLDSGLLIATADTRKAICVKLDKVIELCPDIHNLSADEKIKQIEASLPEGMSRGMMGYWLMPSDGSEMSWEALVAQYSGSGAKCYCLNAPTTSDSDTT